MFANLPPALVPALAIIVPALGALFIVASHRHPIGREVSLIVTSIALAAVVLGLGPAALQDVPDRLDVLEVVPGLSLSLAVEPLGLLYAGTASALWILNSLYSIGYVRARKERNQTRFHACFALALTAAMGIAFAANLFTLFVFYELLTLVTYPLVAHAGTERALAAGRRYLTILLGTSLGLFFLAIVITWTVAGTVDFRAGGVLGDDVPPWLTAVLLGLFAFGLGKSALMPLHRWLPGAMVAPTPVSALLHAVAVVKAGVFSFAKVVVSVIGIDHLHAQGAGTWVVAAASVTIIVGSWIAIRQDDLKRRLAYSTVAQLAYVTLAVSLASDMALIGGALQVSAHALAKITLFFAAGSIYVATGKTKVSQLAGLGRRMPWTMSAFAIASVSLIGIPPTLGFVSKWHVIGGALATDQTAAALVLLTGTVLAAFYLLPIVHAAFFLPPGDDEPPARGWTEAPGMMVVPSCLTALGTVLFALVPDRLLALVQAIA